MDGKDLTISPHIPSLLVSRQLLPAVKDVTKWQVKEWKEMEEI